MNAFKYKSFRNKNPWKYSFDDTAIDDGFDMGGNNFGDLSRLREDFTRIFNEDKPSKFPAYPPYNIRRVDDNYMLIEVALAGFRTEDIDLEIVDNMIVIKADAKRTIPEEQYIYKGISSRAFTKKIRINKATVEVEVAKFNNGLLEIWLKRIVNPASVAQKIEIS